MFGRGNVVLKPGEFLNFRHPSRYSSSLLGLPPTEGWRVKARICLRLTLQNGRNVATPREGAAFEFDWLCPDKARFEAMRLRLKALLKAPEPEPAAVHAYILVALLKVPEVAGELTADDLLAAIARRKGHFDGRQELAGFVDKHFPTDRNVIRFYLDRLKEADLNAALEVTGRIWDKSFIEPLVAMCEGGGNDYPRREYPLRALYEHRNDWRGEAGIRSRLNRAVLTFLPILGQRPLGMDKRTLADRRTTPICSA